MRKLLLLFLSACSVHDYDTSEMGYGVAKPNEEYTQYIGVFQGCPSPEFEVTKELTAGERIEAGDILVLTDGVAFKQAHTTECAVGYALTSATMDAKFNAGYWPERD